MDPIAIFILVVVGTVALAIFAAVAAAKRRKELQAWCDAAGLSFDSSRSDDPGDEYALCDVMNEGASRYGDNWCTGLWQGRKICGFDYHYTTGSGKNRTSHSLSIMAVESTVPLSPLTLRGEGLFDKIGQFLGASDINYESDAFNRRYHVASPDRKWAYDVLHVRAIERLMACPCDYHIQFDSQSVVLWDNSSWSPAEFEQAASLGKDLLDMLPGYLLKDRSR